MDHPMQEQDQRVNPKRMSMIDWKQAYDDGKEIYQQGLKQVNTFYAPLYSGELLINHLLDPMQCFKKVIVALWQHICGQKDNYNSRRDLKKENIKQRYWFCENNQLLNAPWILRKEEKSIVKKIIEAICTPTRTMHSLKGAFTNAKEK